MNRLVLKNCTIVNHDRIMKDKTIVIENGIIKSINDSKKEEGIDLKGKYVLPSFVDLHSHLREPGEEFKEDIFSGCHAALSGGYTSIGIMPNTKPPLDNPQSITYIKKREQEFGKIEILPFGALTKNLESVEITEMYDMLKAGARGFSDDGVGTTNSRVFLNALRYASRFNTFITTHCEEKNLSEGGQINESDVSIKSGLNGIPYIEEDIIVYRNLRIATYLKTNLHIAHISTKDTLSLIKNFKKKFKGITCEVTPHHLIFDETVHYDYNTNFKVKPSLKSKRDVESLINGINDGTIDAIVTDHAPHQTYEKEVEFIEAPFGIIGFETAFSSLFTYLVLKNKVDLKTIVKLLSYNPAKMLNLSEKYIETGYEANLTIFDPEKEIIVNRDFIKSKSTNTPFYNKKLRGSVEMTIFKGNIVFRRNDG